MAPLPGNPELGSNHQGEGPSMFQRSLLHALARRYWNKAVVPARQKEIPPLPEPPPLVLLNIKCF
ncbi:hypothetical protein XENTR_v10020334 [Xenopus tropicalis]|nr:hypothetical protein XENTR_v10020334 [Xenopus tropicalis]